MLANLLDATGPQMLMIKISLPEGSFLSWVHSTIPILVMDHPYLLQVLLLKGTCVYQLGLSQRNNSFAFNISYKTPFIYSYSISAFLRGSIVPSVIRTGL